MNLLCLPSAGWWLGALLTTSACATAPTPQTSQDFNDRGAALAQRGQLARAMADFDRAIELDSGNALAYNNRAYARVQMRGELELSIADYTRAIELDPLYFEAYLGRALALGVSGQLDRALGDCTRAIELYPRSEKAYSVRAMIQFERGEHRRSEEDLRKAQALGAEVDPAFVEALREASGGEQ